MADVYGCREDKLRIFFIFLGFLILQYLFDLTFGERGDLGVELGVLLRWLDVKISFMVDRFIITMVLTAFLE